MGFTLNRSLLLENVFVVYEKLENYYDNNSTDFVIAFDNEDDANIYVEESPQHDYIVVKEGVYRKQVNQSNEKVEL